MQLKKWNLQKQNGGKYYEKNLSAEKTCAQKSTWFYGTNEQQKRTQGFGPPPGKRAQSSLCLICG